MASYDKVFLTLTNFAHKYDLNIQLKCSNEQYITIVMTHDSYRVERKVSLNELDTNSDIMESMFDNMAQSLYLRSTKSILMQVTNLVDDTCKIVANISNYAGITPEKLDILKNLHEIKQILGYNEEDLNE